MRYLPFIILAIVVVAAGYYYIAIYKPKQSLTQLYKYSF